jgi:hypothetical protein
MHIDNTSETTIFGTEEFCGSSSRTCVGGGAVSCSRRSAVWIYALS